MQADGMQADGMMQADATAASSGEWPGDSKDGSVGGPSPFASPSPLPSDAVLCDGMREGDYCDCSGDCTRRPDLCACGDAQACCAAHFIDILSPQPRHSPGPFHSPPPWHSPGPFHSPPPGHMQGPFHSPQPGHSPGPSFGGGGLHPPPHGSPHGSQEPGRGRRMQNFHSLPPMHSPGPFHSPPPWHSPGPIPSPQHCPAGCPRDWIADNICDTVCNIPECNYDGGDCKSRGRESAPGCPDH